MEKCHEDCAEGVCLFEDIPDNPPLDVQEIGWPDQEDPDDPNLTGTELPDDFEIPEEDEDGEDLFS